MTNRNHKDFIYTVSMLSAVFHDFGKIMTGFQNALRPGKATKQAMRHEFMSYIILSWLTSPTRPLINQSDRVFKTDKELIKGIITGEWLEQVDLFLHLLDKPGYDTKEALQQFVENEVVEEDLFRHLKSNRKIIECTKLVVLTHHKMITYKVGLNGPSYCEHDDSDRYGSFIRHNRFDVENIIDFMKCFHKTNTFLPMIKKNATLTKMNDRFLRVVKTFAQSTLTFVSSIEDWELEETVCVDASLIARNFMIIGDNKGSSIKTVCDTYNKSNVAFANTNGTSLADPLVQHLTRVVLYTHKALTSLDKEFINVVEAEDMPENITGVSPEQFSWQNRAVEATRDYKDGGFIAFVLAGTGSGKTIADMKILSSVSNELRATTILPLTTLTEQTFLSYRNDIGLLPNQAAIVMGDKISQRITQGKDDNYLSNGRDEEVVFDDSYLDLETDSTVEGLVVPDILHSNSKRRALDVFLTYPVVACTADMLVPGIDLSHKRGMATYIRSITSDLIIDEMDNYGYEDQVILCRLVYQAGLFGKKVIISSATLPPVLVTELMNNYQNGYTNHCKFMNKEKKISVALISEYVERMVDSQDFGPAYKEMLKDHTAQMRQAPIRRRVDTFPITHNDWKDEIIEQARILHKQNRIPGTDSSIGIVRLNRVDDVIKLSRYILNSDCDDNIRVVCLHSRFPMVIRNNMEHELARILSRKNGNSPEKDVVFKNHGKDLMVIIIASNIIETGRDFDFDWAITEPCSEQSIVQLAGRVRRHRYNEYTNINIMLSSVAIRNLADENGKEKKNGIGKPGIDTPIETGAPQKDERDIEPFSWPVTKNILAHSRQSKLIFKLDQMKERLDSEHIINYFTINTSFAVTHCANILGVSLGQIRENEKETDSIYHVSSYAYANDPIARRNFRIYTARQFRRNNGNREFVFAGWGDNIRVPEGGITCIKETCKKLFLPQEIYMLKQNTREKGKIMSVSLNISKSGGTYGIFTGFMS